jgi:lysophospholipase L1-like esterase
MSPLRFPVLNAAFLLVTVLPFFVLRVAADPSPSPTVSQAAPKKPQSPVEPVTQSGNGYDWMARHEAALSLKPTLNPDVVFIGDSITHHWGGLPEGRLKLGEKVLNSAFPNHRILNLGFGSDRTQHVLWRLDHGELAGLDPKWVVINIGSNNTSDHNGAPEIMEGIKAVCERVKSQLPRSKIILMSIFPRDEKADCPRRKMIAEINRMIADYAKANGIINLDIGDKFLDANGSVRKDLLPDRCHPVEPGYRIWADALIPYLDGK